MPKPICARHRHARTSGEPLTSLEQQVPTRATGTTASKGTSKGTNARKTVKGHARSKSARPLASRQKAGKNASTAREAEHNDDSDSDSVSGWHSGDSFDGDYVSFDGDYVSFPQADAASSVSGAPDPHAHLHHGKSNMEWGGAAIGFSEQASLSPELLTDRSRRRHLVDVLAQRLQLPSAQNRGLGEKKDPASRGSNARHARPMSADMGSIAHESTTRTEDDCRAQGYRMLKSSQKAADALLESLLASLGHASEGSGAQKSLDTSEKETAQHALAQLPAALDASSDSLDAMEHDASCDSFDAQEKSAVPSDSAHRLAHMMTDRHANEIQDSPTGNKLRNRAPSKVLLDSSSSSSYSSQASPDKSPQRLPEREGLLAAPPSCEHDEAHYESPGPEDDSSSKHPQESSASPPSPSTAAMQPTMGLLPKGRATLQVDVHSPPAGVNRQVPSHASPQSVSSNGVSSDNHPETGHAAGRVDHFSPGSSLDQLSKSEAGGITGQGHRGQEESSVVDSSSSLSESPSSAGWSPMMNAQAASGWSALRADSIMTETVAIVKQSLAEETGRCQQQFTLLRMREDTVEERARMQLKTIENALKRARRARECGLQSKDVEDLENQEQLVRDRLAAEKADIARQRAAIRSERSEMRKQLKEQSDAVLNLRQLTIALQGREAHQISDEADTATLLHRKPVYDAPDSVEAAHESEHESGDSDTNGVELKAQDKNVNELSHGQDDSDESVLFNDLYFKTRNLDSIPGTPASLVASEKTPPRYAPSSPSGHSSSVASEGRIEEVNRPDIGNAPCSPHSASLHSFDSAAHTPCSTSSKEDVPLPDPLPDEQFTTTRKGTPAEDTHVQNKDIEDKYVNSTATASQPRTWQDRRKRATVDNKEPSSHASHEHSPAPLTCAAIPGEPVLQQENDQSPRTTLPPDQPRQEIPINVCGYLSDVEGNLDYFERYVARSEILEWGNAARSKLRFKREDAMLVFGGDSQDKGIGDIRFTKLLLALKEEYPERVEFIIGNRDANKLRLASELQEDCINDAAVLTDRSFPYWDAAEKRVTPQMFLDKNPVDNGGRENTAANRLRYILKHTMGADGAFEMRREELSILRECGKEAVSDEDVVESYRDEVDPAKEGHNFMLKYLQQGRLAYVFGEHLFVHGAVNGANVGTVPGSTKRMERAEEWVEALNAWCRQEVADFVSDPYSGKNGRDRKGSGLMDYGVPGGNGGATVVYSHNLRNGNGAHLAPEVRAYLGASGIKSVITGHQPHGDCPQVIRSGLVTAISADTSYSQMGHKSAWGVDNRGEAVSEVLLYADGGSEVHGVLADGSKVRYRLGGAGGGDKFVGRQLRDGYWVKAKTDSAEAEYVLCLGEGFKLTVSRRTEREMEALTEADFVEADPVPIGVCGYLSDVEGNLDYFERYVARSEILEWGNAARSKLRFKREDAMLVFGGDSQDKGIGDIRFTKLLLALKEEYPERVEFIIGNRDANKLRLASELQEDCINDAAVLTDRSFPYWDAAEKRVTPQMFLDKNPVDNGGRENTAANRLRYILKHTMGADGAFEMRREELSILRECGKEAVSDEDVVESYRDEVDPAKEGHNFMLKYLQQGRLAYVFGEHLFVHGAVNGANVGTVPGSTKRMERAEEWVEALNAWCRQEVADFVSDPYSGKNGRDRKGSGLMDYGVPGGNGGATVVYSHNLRNGNGAHLAPEVRAYLGASGIKSVITGHQPHGDCPQVIRSGLVTAISADTSYSQMGHKSAWGVDNRGEAVSEVLLYADGGSEVHGVLADGSKVRYRLGGAGGGTSLWGGNFGTGIGSRPRRTPQRRSTCCALGRGSS
jgi:hypothetical protein